LKPFQKDRNAKFAFQRGEHATAKEVGDRVVNFTTRKGKGRKFFALFLAVMPQRGQLTPKEKNALNLSAFSGCDATARVNGENFSPFSGLVAKGGKIFHFFSSPTYKQRVKNLHPLGTDYQKRKTPLAGGQRGWRFGSGRWTYKYVMGASLANKPTTKRT